MISPQVGPYPRVSVPPQTPVNATQPVKTNRFFFSRKQQIPPRALSAFGMTVMGIDAAGMRPPTSAMLRSRSAYAVARNRTILAAASRPSCTAVTTRSAPRTPSPPAKIFAFVVW